MKYLRAGNKLTETGGGRVGGAGAGDWKVSKIRNHPWPRACNILSLPSIYIMTRLLPDSSSIQYRPTLNSSAFPKWLEELVFCMETLFHYRRITICVNTNNSYSIMDFQHCF